MTFNKRILYCGDNRDRLNWGCRATSIALGSILSRLGDVSEVVNGKEASPFTMTPIPWKGAWPSRLWWIIDNFPSGRFSRFQNTIKNKLNIFDDFIEESTEKSVNRFLQIKNRHSFLNNLYTQLESVDTVVINGEGTYIFSTPPRRDSLFYNFLVLLSHKFRKKVYLLNAMFSECSSTGMNHQILKESLRILSTCEAVTTRDPYSLEFLHNNGLKNNVHHFPDALFTWTVQTQDWVNSISGNLELIQPFGSETYESIPNLNFDSPYVCLSGSSSAAWRQDAAFEGYLKLTKELSRLSIQVLLVPSCSGDIFLQRVASLANIPILPVSTPIRLCAGILGKAKVLVSGRFHPSIMASNAGTPCVFLGSNSHKTLSLQKMLEYENPHEYSDIPDNNEIKKIVSCVSQLISSQPRDKIVNVVKKRCEEAQNLDTVFESSPSENTCLMT